MKFGHAPYPRHAPHIEAAFERATVEKADGVLSGFQLTPPDGKGNRAGAGFAFGRKGFPDEAPLRISSIKSIAGDLITTSSGSRYVIADYYGDSKAELKVFKAELRAAKSAARMPKQPAILPAKKTAIQE